MSEVVADDSFLYAMLYDGDDSCSLNIWCRCENRGGPEDHGLYKAKPIQEHANLHTSGDDRVRENSTGILSWR